MHGVVCIGGIGWGVGVWGVELGVWGGELGWGVRYWVGSSGIGVGVGVCRGYGVGSRWGGGTLTS